MFYPAIIILFAEVVNRGAPWRPLPARGDTAGAQFRIKVCPDCWPPVPGSVVLGEIVNCDRRETRPTSRSVGSMRTCFSSKWMSQESLTLDNEQKHMTPQ
jgi:hypothetical protein